MDLSKKDVEWVANLAHIELTKSDVDKYSKELSVVLGHIDELQKVDTKNVNEVMQITGLRNVIESDEVRKCEISREELLKQAPMSEKGYIKVKSVFGDRE